MGKYSNYTGVGMHKVWGKLKWVCRYKTEVTYHDTEREAAKQYDLRRISEGKDPKNILKPVKKK